VRELGFITDNHMPRMTGLEMIEKLNFARMSIPVIMATGNVPTDEFSRKPWLKPEVALQKPFTNRDLLDAIINVLGGGGENNDYKEPPLPRFF
jgi:FixJ family two-component response regulator